MRWITKRSLCLILPAAVLCSVGCSRNRGIEETKKRGDDIIRALDQFRADHTHYPKALVDLTPKYLPEFLPPTWGLRKWDYSVTADGFDLGVDESTRTGDGNARWLRYLGKHVGWETGD